MPGIPVNTPVITAADRRAVGECLEAGWVSSEGPQVAHFEEKFAQATGRRHAVAVSSGTAALDVAIRALGIGPGDEVLVPSLTIISCASSIVASGARPIPVDCDPADWNAHLPHFEQGLTSRTRALMLVHLYGLCADLDPILEWAEQHGLWVIEDASQAMGMHYRDRRCGSFGQCSVFSLYANKLITTGEGGVVVTDNPELAQRCRSLRNLCFSPKKRFWHEDLGWNYRMTAMQAALGASQLDRLSDLARQKVRMGLRYHRALNGLDALRLAPATTGYCDNGYWVFGLVVDPASAFSREDILKFLAERRIGTRTFFYGLHEQPVLRERQIVQPMQLPGTEDLSTRGFYLPSGLGLSRSDQNAVIRAVMEFVERNG